MLQLIKLWLHWTAKHIQSDYKTIKNKKKLCAELLFSLNISTEKTLKMNKITTIKIRIPVNIIKRDSCETYVLLLVYWDILLIRRTKVIIW